MKTTTSVIATMVLASSFLNGQGSLTPPAGVPGPVMKTLDQVEARIPLVAGQAGVAVDGAGTITISQPGSYYLTANLVITTANADGIVINSDDVTLDLNGFALICTSVNGGEAIFYNSRRGITIRNGRIVGGTTQTGGVFTPAGWIDGIDGNTLTGATARVSDVTVRGIRAIGITLGSSTMAVVERCSVDTCGTTGILAGSVLDSAVRNAGGIAIFVEYAGEILSGTVQNCFGGSVGSGAGISAQRATVSNSRGVSESGDGLTAAQAINCAGISNSGSGLEATTASNCQGTSGSGIGLAAVNATNCYGLSISGAYGMSISGTASFCQGTRSGGIAISAGIAIGCTTGGGTINSSQKHLGTP
jgi:hypothetical protein